MIGSETRANDISRLVLEIDSNGVVKATGNLNVFNQTAKKTEAQTTKLDDVIKKLSPSCLTAVAGVTALVGAFKSMTRVGSSIVDMASHFEKVQTELGTVLQDVEKGKELFEDLRKFSFETTFGVDELASASTQLLNVGESTRTLQKDLKMLGDLAGGDKQKFAELTNIFAKIKSQGNTTAMQLQQINLRGIPISQTLKQMGVTGNATAEQLTEAFEKLTGEGGQFKDAMNNIIDTIEGKRGFITDTWKEILVNFGELSGLTEVYKQGLDVVYNILDNVNNKLKELNENPIMKALVQGTIVTLITAIVGVIVGSLIPALTTVVALIGAIDPAVWIGLLAGIGTGAIFSAINVINAQKEIKKTVTDTNNELEKQQKIISGGGSTYEQQKKFQKDMLQNFIDKKAELEKQLSEYKETKKSYEEIQKGWLLNNGKYTNAEYHEAVNNLDKVNKKIDDTTSAIGRANKAIEEQQKTVNNFDEIDRISDSMKALQNSYATIFSKTTYGKAKQELEQYNNELKKVNEYKDLDGKTINGKKFNFTENQKDEIDKTVEYLENKIKNTKIEITVALQKDYQKDLQNALGFSNKQVSNGATKSTVGAFDTYLKEAERTNDLIMGKNSLFNTTKSELLKSQVDTLTKAYQTILTSENYSGKEESLITVYNQLLEVRKQYQSQYVTDTTKELEDKTKILKSDESIYNKLVKIYAIENKTDELNAKDLLDLERKKKLIEREKSLYQDIYDKQMELYDHQYESLSDYATLIEQIGKDMLKLGLQGGGGKYLEGKVYSGVNQLINGSDVGTFVDSLTKTGDPLIALAETFLKSLVNVIGGMEGLDSILNPITDMLKEFAPIFKLYMIPLIAISQILSQLVKLIFALIKNIEWINNFFNLIESTYDSLITEQKTETATLKELNSQYKSLSKAIEEQEEYYIAQKKKINSDTFTDSILNAKPVNDMILTSKGAFSTSPQDTIMAMKHPENLGGVTYLQPVINDYGGNNVEVTTERNSQGIEQLVVNISKKIADDYARGVNGWDSAYSMKQTKLNGRSVS